MKALEISRPTPAQQLEALGSLHDAEMSREDMIDAAMYRRRVKVDGPDSISDKEAERIAQMFAKHFA